MEGHPKAYHQLITRRGKANTINDHETKGYIAASQGYGRISKFSSNQK